MPQSKQIKAKTKYQFRGDTVSNWETLNPILENREPGLVLDEGGKTIGFKIGDGTTAWNDLEYHNINTAQMNTNFANALKGTKSGAAVVANNVSPIEHNTYVTLRNKNLWNKTYGANKSNWEILDDYYYVLPIKVGKGNIVTVSYKNELTENGLGFFTAVMTERSSATSVTTWLYHNTNSSAYTKRVVTLTAMEENIYIRTSIPSKGGLDSNAFALFVEYINDTLQIELGTTETNYTPYVADLSSVEVSRYGKNLFDINNIESGEKGTFNINEDDSITFYFNSTYTSYFPFAYWLEVLPNTDYVISIGRGTSIKTIYGYTDMLRGNKLFSKSLIDGKYATFNSGNNSRVLIGMYSQVEYRETTATEETVRNIQIELGTIPTNYEPYKEPQTATANTNGTVDGLTSLSPNITLITDTDGIIIECEYNKDINKLSFENGSGGSIDPAILQKKIEPWQPNTAYKVGDVVVAKTYDNETDSIDTVVAICIEEHVSSDTRQLVIEQDGSNWSYNSLYAKYDSSGNIINNYYATKEELNNKFSTGLKREVVDDFVTPDMAEDNVIYMVPDPNATEDNNYLEYIKTKHKYSVANGQDYIYAKDESEFSIILLRNGLFVTMVSDDYIDRPQGAHMIFNGFNPINEIQEDVTITVDSVESYLKSYIIDLELNGQSAIVNLGDGSNEWDVTPDDDVMKSFGYLYRSQITYEILSERESMELIGSTAVDLSAYATKTYVGNVINSAIDKTYSASVNKKSEKAQSGIAVDAAITQRVSSINGKINTLTSSVNSLISSSISREIVDILPEKEQAKINTIYMVKNNSTDDNVYDEYLAINVPQEDIIFNNIPATIRFKTSGDNIEDNSELSVKNTTFSIYITSSDGTNPNIRRIIPDSSDIDHFIQLNINEIDNSLVTLIDENKYQLISYSGYTNGIINKLSFNINKTVYELIGSTAVDLSDYYTKDEINEQIGDIEAALDSIIVIQESLIGGDI